MPTLSLVIPQWPLDAETGEALRRCVSSFPSECERIVVVNDGTGYARNVNVGLRLASGDFIGVVNNDCRPRGRERLRPLRPGHGHEPVGRR